MFLVAANTRQALVGQKEWITTGSSGIQVQFLFSDDWNGLSKFAVFRNAEIEESVIPIALPSSNLTELPAENCAAEYVDEKVYVGVYGTDGLGHIIIPTIWVSLGVLKEGAAYEGMDPPQPTPDMWAQILAIAQNAGAENAEAAEAAAGRAEEAAELLTDVSATATTLEPGNQATANYYNGVFEFGIPKGTKGDPLTYEDLTEEQKEELVQGPILDAQNAAVTAVGNARVNAVNAVGSAGTTAVNAVNQAGTTQVGNVNQAGTTQVQAVADKGAEVIGSIPPDYSDLADEVDDLNRHLSGKQDAPATAGTAGQVLSLDDQLNPVWADQTGGGGDVSNCAPIIINTASGDIASFADGANNRKIRKIVGTIVPVQSGTGDPSPDNIRPISGWTGAEIEQSKSTNLFYLPDGALGGGNRRTTSITDGIFSVVVSATVASLQCVEFSTVPALRRRIPPGTYVFRIFNLNSDSLNAASMALRYEENGEDKTIVNGGTFTVTAENGALYTAIQNTSQIIYSTGVSTFSASITPVALDTNTYVKAVRATLSVNWEDEAGTIYGGTVTLNEDGSADVDVTGTLERLNPTANESIWQGSNGGRLTFVLSGTITSVNDLLCNQLAFTIDAADIGNNANLSNYLASNTSDGNTRILLHIKDVTDKTSTLQYLQNNNVMLYRRLNSVVNTYHIPNVGQLYTFFGTNNVWIDTGAITECDYPADTKTYVDDQVSAVTDVQINGTSILRDGVANIPIGQYDLGAVKIGTTNGYYGIYIIGNGVITVQKSSDSEVKSGSNQYRPVVPYNQHAAAFYGLAKAAGDTTQDASANAVGTYTEEAKSAIHEMLNGSVAVSGTTPTIAAKSGITYVCGEVATLDITPPASGIFEVQFVSGSTPTVLTATGVTWVNGFDPTALEANKTYDISISNGIGVAVWI